MTNAPRAVDFTRFQGRELVIDLAALRRIEKRLRVERADPKLQIWLAAREFLLAALEGSVGLTELTVFLEEGLRAKWPEVTEAQVLALLTPAGDNAATSATLAVAAAISANFPEAKKGESAGESGGRPLPGSDSGAAAASSGSLNRSSGG